MADEALSLGEVSKDFVKMFPGTCCARLDQFEVAVTIEDLFHFCLVEVSADDDEGVTEFAFSFVHSL